MIGAMMGSESARDEILYLEITGVQYFLRVCARPDRPGTTTVRYGQV